ncbi:MAG: hypothetical protein A2V66_09550 [Ignavibacteria bacterium RBG_13_36_8]|nr:MAG: hypothetical protein A2V66_09550 [Ignavibacteria bacterium RBG_13_36_8]
MKFCNNKRFSFGGYLLFLSLLFIAETKAQSTFLLEIQIDSSTTSFENFGGFGAEWDSRNYTAMGINDNDFKIITDRIEWMKMPITRIMMLTKWCYDGRGGYSWDNENMQALYKHLDYCQNKGIDVVLCEWGIEPEWLNIGELNKVDNPKYAEAIGEYMDYLLNTKNYTCIKYFELVNEPNFETQSFERWYEAVKNVYNEFIKRRIYYRLYFAGPGSSESNYWYNTTVDILWNIISTYTFHKYAKIEEVKNGSFHEYVKDMTDYVYINDPDSKNKKVILGEAGMRDGQTTSANTNINSYYYGMFMADYAIQAARRGIHAVIAWMLDDNSHPDFQWGLWNNKKEGMKLRPWFYTWSLLTHCFPKGSTIYRINSRSIDVRAMAAKISIIGKWSFCIVNLSDKSITAQIKIPDEEIQNFEHYIYSEASALRNEKGFPKPVDSLEINLNDGVDVECPGNSVTFLTSQ